MAAVRACLLEPHMRREREDKFAGGGTPSSPKAIADS